MAVVPHATLSAVEALPEDAHNARLLAQAHPRDWRNPVPRNTYNLVVLSRGERATRHSTIAVHRSLCYAEAAS